MRIRATQPPSSGSAEIYRREGYWHEARSVADHIDDLTRAGDRIALVDNNSQWTYRQLVSMTMAMRASLVAVGVHQADTVLIIAPMNNYSAAAYLATLLQGAVAVLLDRKCGVADLVNAVAAAPPRVAFATDADTRRLALEGHCPVLALKEPSQPGASISADRQRRLDPDAPAAVVFTSGTTSTPKGVIHTLNSLRCGAANMISALDVVGEDGFFLPAPLASITGLLQLHAALRLHARLIMEEEFSAQSSLERLESHGATVVGGAPIIMQTLFDESMRQGGNDLPVRCIAVGGSMIPPSLLSTARALGITPVRVYGSSEAPFSCSTDLTTDHPLDDDGAPQSGVEVTVDDAGRHELLVRGPHRFHGYLRAPDNVDAFNGDWFRTGDQAIVADGRITITGRLKEVVVRKGMKISLTEIDCAAEELGESAAYGVADQETGERLVLAVRANATGDLSYESVIAHLTKMGLAKWKLPEEIIIWHTPLPRTASGKISRQRVAQRSGGLPALVAPRLAARPARQE